MNREMSEGVSAVRGLGYGVLIATAMWALIVCAALVIRWVIF